MTVFTVIICASGYFQNCSFNTIHFKTMEDCRAAERQFTKVLNMRDFSAFSVAVICSEGVVDDHAR